MSVHKRLQCKIYCLILLCASGWLSACASVERAFIPSASLLAPSYAENTPNSTVMVDHAVWGAFLGKYVAKDNNGVNRVAYGQVTPTDKAQLLAYRLRLRGTDVTTLSNNEQLVFWINLYNAETVGLILDHYPVPSIRTIKYSYLSVGPWSEKNITVGGDAISLHDIEHRIIRPRWTDPRIHYALNCAAVDCPNLANVPYEAELLDTQFEAAAKDYVNDTRGVDFNQSGDLILSKIYSWYLEDFGMSESDIIAHVLQYAEPAKADRIRAAGSVASYRYDWALNGS